MLSFSAGQNNKMETVAMKGWRSDNNGDKSLASILEYGNFYLSELTGMLHNVDITAFKKGKTNLYISDKHIRSSKIVSRVSKLINAENLEFITLK